MAYEAETNALLLRFSDTLTVDEEIAWDNLIFNLKDEGLWDKIHALSIFKNHGNSDDSLINIKENDHNITMINTPTFNSSTGWTFSSGSSQYGAWDYVASVDTNIDTADCSFMFLTGATALSTSVIQALCGATGGSNTTALYQRGGNGLTAQVQGAGGNIDETPDLVFDINSMHSLNYDGLTTSYQKDGVELWTGGSTQSGTLVVQDMLIAAASNGGTPIYHADVVLETVCIADYLTPTEQATFQTEIEKFFTEIVAVDNSQDSGAASISAISSDLTNATTLNSTLSATTQISINLLSDSLLSIAETIIINIESNIDSDSVLSVLLGVIKHIEIVIPSNTELIPTLSSLYFTSSDLTSNTELSSDLNGIGVLEIDLIVNSQLEGLLFVGIPFTDVQGSTTLNSTISSIVDIISNISSSSIVEGIVKQFDNINCSILGYTDLNGDLDGIGILESLITGHSNIETLNFFGLGRMTSNINNLSLIDPKLHLITNIFSELLSITDIDNTIQDVNKQTIYANLISNTEVAASATTEITSNISQFTEITGNLIDSTKLEIGLISSSSLEGTLKAIGKLNCTIQGETSILNPELTNKNFEPIIIKYLHNIYIGDSTLNKMYIDEIEIV